MTSSAPEAPIEPTPPEAHLEAVVGQVLSKAFIGIDRSKVRHQTIFKVKVGHKTREHDGASALEATGRADIILYHENRAVALIELKRGELILTPDDVEQAKSYAKQFDRRPPLVVVTNGDDVMVIDGNTGEAWSAEGDAEAAVAKLLKNAVAIASADMRWAVEVLMGPGSSVWPEVVRERTKLLMERFTAPVGSGGKPFAKGLHYGREATDEVLAALDDGASFIFVEGAPLAGKSNLLRDLAERTQDSQTYAVLMLRGGTTGLFQTLANVLSDALEWDVEPGAVRQWLRRLSKYGAGPTLVLAVDGLQPGSSMAHDLEELADTRYGPKLRVVAAADDASRFMTEADRRTRTAIADRSAVVTVETLSKVEFDRAAAVLRDLGVRFAHGAGHAEDLRAPWVLRALFDQLGGALARTAEEGHFRLLPSLGLDLIDLARANFRDQHDLVQGYRWLAADFLADTASSTALGLARSNGFLVRRDALGDRSESVLATLVAQGWASLQMNPDDIQIVTPTAPEVFLSEVARALAVDLLPRIAPDPVAAARWLVEAVDGLYLGDLIGAQALRDLAGQQSINLAFIEALLDIVPDIEVREEGFFALEGPNGEVIHLLIEKGMVTRTDASRSPLSEPTSLEDDLLSMQVDTGAWMLLAQLARLPMAMGDDDNRLDAYILHVVGQCPFPLMRARTDFQGHLEHDLGDLGRVLCFDNGAIEPATVSMARMFSRPWKHQDDWIDAALETRSMPLVHRVLIALTAVRDTVQAKASWAAKVLEDRIRPFIAEALAAEATSA